MLHTVWHLSRSAQKGTCKNNHVNVFTNKVTAQLGTMLGFAYLMPDCWLEVILHLEGPSFSLVPANADFVPILNVAAALFKCPHYPQPMLCLL
jgi:hypothetical protein